jgi:arabinose-5-phosphate isomerase
MTPTPARIGDHLLLDVDRAVIDHGRDVIAFEIEGLRQLAALLDESFARAVALIAASSGRIAVSGVGKSGHIGRKIASTLASTGTPAYFLHPMEAAHGDLGMMVAGDVAIVISNSGETRALRPVIDHARRLGVPVIAIAAQPQSPLMQAADVALRLPDAPEACALGVAPSTSTTATLALGDALAIAVMRVRNFSREGFGLLHPGGPVGLRLSRVAALMHAGDRMPLVMQDAPIAAIIAEINAKGFGVTGVIRPDGSLAGVITDGDIRRNVARLDTVLAAALMHQSPRTIDPDASAEAALALLREHRISCLFVVPAGSAGSARQPLGLVHLHDFLRAGFA